MNSTNPEIDLADVYDRISPVAPYLAFFAAFFTVLTLVVIGA